MSIREVEFQKDKLKGVAEQLKRDMPSLVTAYAELAKTRKAFYDAHIEAGFTPNQAMELTKEYGNIPAKV